MKSILRKLLTRRGYTIDQTILIVAIIAILITLIIVTIGWTLLSRTSGSKMGSFTTQLDSAVNTYYGKNHVFPSALSDLNNDGLIGFRNSGGTFYHDIGGSTGVVSMGQVAFTAAQAQALGVGGGAAGTFLVTTFTAVPSAEAQEANKSVDNDDASASGTGWKTGHIYFMANTTTTCSQTPTSQALTTSTVTMCYVGQKVS